MYAPTASQLGGKQYPYVKWVVNSTLLNPTRIQYEINELESIESNPLIKWVELESAYIILYL